MANFGSYNKTYGTLGAVVVALLWLYITNNAILFGALFNAERQREHGLLKDETGQIDLRDSKGKALPYARTTHGRA